MELDPGNDADRGKFGRSLLVAGGEGQGLPQPGHRFGEGAGGDDSLASRFDPFQPHSGLDSAFSREPGRNSGLQFPCGGGNQRGFKDNICRPEIYSRS